VSEADICRVTSPISGIKPRGVNERTADTRSIVGSWRGNGGIGYGTG
jgi:hypothetical protein